MRCNIWILTLGNRWVIHENIEQKIVDELVKNFHLMPHIWFLEWNETEGEERYNTSRE